MVITCKFIHPFKKRFIPEQTYTIKFNDDEVKKLSTLQNMIDILGQPEETEIIDIPIKIYPDTIYLLKSILFENILCKDVIENVCNLFLSTRNDRDSLNIILNLLTLIDYMDINKDLEDIIYKIVANYIIKRIPYTN